MASSQQSDPDPSAESTADPGSRWRKLLAAALTAVVLAIVFAGILPKFGDYGEAWDSVNRMSLVQLAALAGAVIVSIVVYVFPLQLALPGLGYWSAFMTRQSSFTISNAVPAGGAVGLGVQYSMLSGGGASGPDISAAIVIVAVFNLLVTLVLPVLGVVAMFGAGRPSTAQILGALGGLLFVALLVSLFAVVLRSEHGAQRVGELSDRVFGAAARRLGRPTPSSMAERLVSFRRATIDVVRHRWVSLTISSLAQQLTQFAVLVVALRATQSGRHVGISIISAFAAFSLARLASFIPITPGGLGTVDAGLVGVLVSLGAHRGDALAATLLWRAASWIPQVLIGLLTLIFWRLRALRSR